MRLPSSDWILLYSSPLATAKLSLHFPKPSFSTTSTDLFFSYTTFSPTIPISATASSTYCGISSSLKKNTCRGKLPASVFSLLAPLEMPMPHSFRSLMESSCNRPDFCTASLSMICYLVLNKKDLPGGKPFK